MQKQLKNCIRLRSQIKIYVPSTYEVDKDIDNQKHVDETIEFLAKIFGGATVTEAYGAWISANGQLVKEFVSLVFAFAGQEQLEQSIDAIYDYCIKLKLELKQESIALEINGELYLI